MDIESIPNRNWPPAMLLRESFRDGGKVRKRTLRNLSDWSTDHIEGLRSVLECEAVIPGERDAFTVMRSLPAATHGASVVHTSLCGGGSRRHRDGARL